MHITPAFAEVTAQEKETLLNAGREVYRLGLQAVEKVIREKRFEEFGIGAEQAKHISASWARQDLDFFSRVDFSYDGTGAPKFYEINGDYASTLKAAAEETPALAEKITQRFNALRYEARGETLHLTSFDHPEDTAQALYLETLAQKAGWKTQYVELSQIGANEEKGSPWYGKLYDAQDNEIKSLYKMAAWEMLYSSDYAPYIARDTIQFIDPAWKALLCNKRLSVLLWEMFPDHPNLLPAYATPKKLGAAYVEKNLFGWGGEGVNIIENGVPTKSDAPKIYQAYHPLPHADGKYYQAETWLVGDAPAAIDFRRGPQRVLDNENDSFLPHIVKERKLTP